METIEQPSGTPHPLLRRPDPGIRAAAAKEIFLAGLGEGDLLLIQTANSVYSFLVTNAKEKGGLLMGGRLGEASAQVLLAGAQSPAADAGEPDRTRIVAGLPVVFYVATPTESTRLATSAIKSLTHIKAIPASRSGKG